MALSSATVWEGHPQFKLIPAYRWSHASCVPKHRASGFLPPIWQITGDSNSSSWSNKSCLLLFGSFFVFSNSLSTPIISVNVWEWAETSLQKYLQCESVWPIIGAVLNCFAVDFNNSANAKTTKRILSPVIAQTITQGHICIWNSRERWPNIIVNPISPDEGRPSQPIHDEKTISHLAGTWVSAAR